MHLVDDEYAVTAVDRRNLHLVGEVADVVDRVVRRGVEFDDVERAVFVECAARGAFVAGVSLGGGVSAVDGLGEYAGAGSLAYAS